jgi:hypothetical protein
MNGHLTRQCPNKSSAPGAGGQSRPQGQQNYTYSKVNHVTTEEAQQAQDVVLGMFLASSHLVYLIWEHRIPLYHHHLLQNIICS